MSLQVCSPHSHTQFNDPQSPYPCTPSTLCSSPLPQSGSGGSTSHNQSYFRPSHHQHHFLLREDSLPSISSPNNQTHNDEHEEGEEENVILGDYHRFIHRRHESGTLDYSPEMPMSIRSPSMSTLGGTPDRASPHGAIRGPFHSDSTQDNITSGTKTHPSAASIPIILAGLNGIRSIQRQGSRLESNHKKETLEDLDVSRRNPGERLETDQEEEPQQRGSVGLGLGILQDSIQPAQGTSLCRSVHSPTHIHSHRALEADETHSTIQPEASSHGETANTDLTAPRQDRADSWTSSLVSTGDDSITSSSSSSSNPQISTPNVSPPTSASVPAKLLPPHDGYAQGVAVKQIIPCYALPEHPGSRTDVLPPSLRNSLKLSNIDENVDSPSQASEFSISAYDYSPHLLQEEEEPVHQKSRWSNHAIEIKPIRLSDNSIARSRVSSATSVPFTNLRDIEEIESTGQATPSSKDGRNNKKKKKKQQETVVSSLVDQKQPKKEIKGRRRAVTLANPVAGEEACKNLRRQSSPPMLSAASRFVDQYATLSHGRRRPTTAAVDGPDGQASSLTPFPSGSDVSSRPHTASAAVSGRLMSSAALFKPLPALPPTELILRSPLAQQQDHTEQNKRSGFLSVQTSPRKAHFSRPGTASPAARSFGLVAPYANLSPTYRDYQSLKSRESFTSLIDRSGGSGSLTGSGNRSRSTSISSSISIGNKSNKKKREEKEKIAFDGPLKYISFAIDQEGFREIRPIFELVETLPQQQHSALASSSSSSTNSIASNIKGPTYRYLPIHAEQAYPFHHSTMESPPVLRRLLIDKYDNRDFMNKQSSLPIKHEGIYAVNGQSCKGNFAWRFEYKVMDRLNLIGKPIPGEKNLIPMAFSCHAGVLDPNNARTRKAIDVVVKTLTSKLEALRVGDLPPECL